MNFVNPFVGDDRGVSPVVGVIFIIGFTILVGIGLFLFGQGLITEEDPRVDAEFTLEYQSEDEIFLVYSSGDEFNSDNTERLYMTGETSDGDDYEITIYDGSAVIDSYHDPPADSLTENMVAVGDDRMESNGVDSGATIQIVWEPSNDRDTQIILDEMVVPDDDEILQQIDEEGTIAIEGGDIIIEG